MVQALRREAEAGALRPHCAELGHRQQKCLRCRVVCGGANNQLAEVRHDAALAVRGIVFVPDYLANAGGVIDFHQETIDDRPDAVLA